MIDLCGRIFDPSVKGWIADVAIATQDGATYAYVDGSLAARDASITYLWEWNIIQDASISAMSGSYVTLAYVDGSLAARDVSIAWLDTNKLEASDLTPYSLTTYVDGSLAARDVSIAYLDSSVTWLYENQGVGTLAELSDVSIASRATDDLIQYNNDTSTWDNITPVDISTLVIDASDYFYTKTQVDASFALITYVDSTFLKEASLGSGLYWVAGSLDVSVAGGSVINELGDIGDVSVSSRSDGDSLYYNNDTSTWDNIATIDISALYYTKTQVDASFALITSIPTDFYSQAYVDGSLAARDVSIAYLDSSVTWLYENQGVGTLAELSDVSIASRAVNDLLQYVDGSTWDNIAPVDISTLTLDASDYFLQINDASTTYLKQTDASTIYRKKGNDSYGQLFIHDASLVKSIPTGTTYIPLGPWTVSDISSNMTYDPSRYFMRPQVTGKYRVNAHISFATDTNSVTTRGVIFQGGVEKNWLHFADFRGVGANIIQSSSITGIIDVSVADTSIGLRIKHDNGGTVVYTIYYANLNISRIAD